MQTLELLTLGFTEYLISYVAGHCSKGGVLEENLNAATSKNPSRLCWELVLLWGNVRRETKGKPKGNQRETKGKPKGNQRETKGKPKGNQRETKGKSLVPKTSGITMCFWNSREAVSRHAICLAMSWHAVEQVNPGKQTPMHMAVAPCKMHMAPPTC